MLFTEEVVTSPLYKSLSLTFKGRAKCGQIKVKKEPTLATAFNITSLPSIISVQGNDDKNDSNKDAYAGTIE
jgi:hypothetical protein